MSKFREMKFDTRGSENVNMLVQKALVNMGYRWSEYGEKVCQHLAAHRYLYTGSDGCITVGDRKQVFREKGFEPVDISWMLPPRETLFVELEDGSLKEVYKDEFLEVVADLEAVV